MNYKITFLLLCIVSTLNAQYSFYTRINSNIDQEPYYIQKINEGHLIISTLFYDDGKSEGIVYKLNLSGELIDSLKLENSLQLSSMFSSSIILENEHIRIFGTREKEDEPGYYRLIWFDIEENLNLIEEYDLDIRSGRWWGYNSIFIKENTNIVMASVVAGNPPEEEPIYWNKFILELDQSGDIHFDSVYNQRTYEGIYDIIPYPNSDSLILFTFINFDGSDFLRQISILSEEFDIISTYTTEIMGYVGSIKSYNDQEFLITGGVDSKIDDFLAIMKYNQNFEMVQYKYFGHQDTSIYPAVTKSLTFLSPNNIFIGSTVNVQPFAFPIENSYISLYNLDESLNLKWQMYYGGDAYYLLKSIEATTDGGCIILGQIYEHRADGPFERDIVVIKVNPDGTITSIDGEAPIPVKNAIIAPNPGQNYLQLHTGMYPALLKVFNINGQVVLEEDIHQNTTTINTSSLKSGTFVWKLIKDGELVETGKWVKE